MPRVCYFTGKKTHSGNKLARRGKPKYLGGVGVKLTGKTRRKFKPNLQTVRAVVDGQIRRIKVSAKAIRMGLVIKPPKRDWQPPAAQPEQAGVEAAAAGETTGPAEGTGPVPASQA